MPLFRIICLLLPSGYVRASFLDYNIFESSNRVYFIPAPHLDPASVCPPHIHSLNVNEMNEWISKGFKKKVDTLWVAYRDIKNPKEGKYSAAMEFITYVEKQKIHMQKKKKPKDAFTNTKSCSTNQTPTC